MTGGKAVCYLRVSTARQGASGLGLEAQRAAVMAHVAAHGMTVVGEYVEVESGKRDDRPQLIAALASCRLHRAQLVIAKLDRLARKVAFISALMDGGQDFVACDMVYANRLTLHLMAAMAEHEREMISQRTKAALAAAKARGTRLGNPNGAAALLDGCKAAAERSALARRARALQHALAAAPSILHAMETAATLADIARTLNQRAIPASRGGIWRASQVARALRYLKHSELPL